MCGIHNQPAGLPEEHEQKEEKLQRKCRHQCHACIFKEQIYTVTVFPQ